MIDECGGVLRGCTSEWLWGFITYFSSCSGYIVEPLSVLKGLRLWKEFEYQAIELHIESKVVVQNILDSGQSSIIGMRLI